MINGFGQARIGRDVELRYTSKGEAVANVSLAFSWGQRDAQGNRETQWVDATLWGARAEALATKLVKGLPVTVLLSDLHIETFQGRDGEMTKLAARVLDIELGGRGSEAPQAPHPPQRELPAAARAPQQPPRPAPPARGGGGASGFDDIDDDIPFQAYGVGRGFLAM
jgi:single-strand DNA-binding protein